MKATVTIKIWNELHRQHEDVTCDLDVDVEKVAAHLAPRALRNAKGASRFINGALKLRVQPESIQAFRKTPALALHYMRKLDFAKTACGFDKRYVRVTDWFPSVTCDNCQQRVRLSSSNPEVSSHE